MTSAKDSGHLLGGALGDCVSDTFTVTGHSKGSPVICGSNAGQHRKFTSFVVVVSTLNSYTIDPGSIPSTSSSVKD